MALIIAASACILIFQMRARRLQKEREAAAARVALGAQVELNVVSDVGDSQKATAAGSDVGSR